MDRIYFSEWCQALEAASLKKAYRKNPVRVVLLCHLKIFFCGVANYCLSMEKISLPFTVTLTSICIYIGIVRIYFYPQYDRTVYT